MTNFAEQENDLIDPTECMNTEEYLEWVAEQEKITKMSYVAERTAEINADAADISSLNIGDGISVSAWTDVAAYTIVKRTPKTITLRADKCTLINQNELKFHAGGFLAHCSNQEAQRYSYEEDADGMVIKITLREWLDEEGNVRRKWKLARTRTFEMGGNAYAGRRAYRDFNF